MLIDMSHYDGKIVADKQVQETFSVLTFRQKTTSVVIILPPRMAACVAMIAEAFNAHMSDDPKTVVAQGGSTGLGHFENAGDFAAPIRHDIPADRFEHPGPVVVGKLSDEQIKGISDYWRDAFKTHGQTPLDSVGVDLAPGSPAMDMADEFNLELDRMSGNVAVGGLTSDGLIRLTDEPNGRKRYLSHGRVAVTAEVAAQAEAFGWRVCSMNDSGDTLVVERLAHQVPDGAVVIPIRVPGENAITPGDGRHVDE